MERIRAASRLASKEAEARKEAFRRMKQEEKIRLAEEWKHQINQADLSRKENAELSELELEARDKAQRILEQANMMSMEQDIEIQNLNKMILGAQCQAIRDAQITEKNQIKAEWAEEKKRLDAMLEQNRQKDLEMMLEKEEQQKQQRIRGKLQILQQIEQHSEERNRKKDLKEVEKLQTQEKLQTLKLTECAELEQKRMYQQQLQREIERINAENIKFKEQKKEEDKLADIRNMQFILQKQKQEEQHEAEQYRRKKEKELRLARLLAQQKRAVDYQAEQDELRARRAQDKKEREWRKKIKEQAEKKAKDDAMLKTERLEQVKQKEHFLSLEAGREKAEFERVLKAQKEAIRKEEEEEVRRHWEARNHAQEVLRQIEEQKQRWREEQSERLKEMDHLKELDRQRHRRLEELKEKKLKDLKSMGLPEKYSKEVEKKARGSRP
ncbi:cilia- and flagella-associated protein 45 [Thalassophryne amazonica]|uniref:cilia- and flagella-associated protein 45 n=1 Tax=Thalassophryne amazonica TaxID=390379 RepID=UPI0014725139|nr:cilia- and flagella-associated protein 45 [Thalassophryne amazonica]XP_034023946.1 cilia- and flagella-associated protein 45 [Thalassophryne amazonica]XP_034023947.1 cilia- and flagella-associated protein 45 [Thalassophryne amazonica]